MIESLNTGNSYLKSLEIYVCLIGKCKVCWWYPTKPPVQTNIIKNKAKNIIINNIWYNVLFPTEHNFQVIYHKSAFSENEIIPIVYFVPPAPHLGWWNSICCDFTHSSFFIPLFCLPFIIPQLVWAECVAIKLGIISPPPLSLFSAICSD